MTHVVMTGGSGKLGRACVRDLIGANQALLSIERARQLLGYEPRHSWRDQR